MRYFWCLCLLLSMAACTSHKKITSSTDIQSSAADVRSAINTMNTAWIKAMKKQDAQTIAGLFDKDGALLSASGKVYQGQEEIVNLMQRNFKALGSVDATITTQNVWVEGDLAYETGRWRYVFVPTSHKRNRKEILGGNYLVIWKRQADRSWKIWKDFGFTNK